MTPEQQALYIRILQFGFSTGSRDRFECLKDYVKYYPEQKEAAISAATEFERGCGFCHEEGELLQTITNEYFFEYCCAR